MKLRIWGIQKHLSEFAPPPQYDTDQPSGSWTIMMFSVQKQSLCVSHNWESVIMLQV